MLRRTLLTAMTIASFQLFSQTDTTKVGIPVDIARNIVKELIEKDFLELQVKNLESQIATQEKIIQNKELEIDNINGQNELLNSISELKETRIENYKNEIRKKNSNVWFWKITTFLGIALGGYFAIK